MGQPITVQRRVQGDMAVFSGDRSLTGQDGARYYAADGVPDNGKLTADLAQRFFDLDPEIDYVYVAYNHVMARRAGGWDEDLLDAADQALKRFFVFYDGADVLGNSLHRTYTSAITGLKTAKRFSRNKTENIQFAAQARNVLDAWAVQNPDATEDDYQAFFDRIIDNSRMNTWSRGWFTRKAEEDRISIRENIEDIQKELAGETRKYNKGDTRIIGGVTYTFDGKVWSD